MIARRTPLPRATKPLPRKRATPRRVGSASGPKLKSRLSDRCDDQARKNTYLRAGVEFLGPRRVPASGTCACCGERETEMDPIEWAHSFPRARRMCRWEVWGAFPIKKSHHAKFTRDSEGWRAFLVGQWGEYLYLERYQTSQRTFGGAITVAFYRETLARLRAEALTEARSRVA